MKTPLEQIKDVCHQILPGSRVLLFGSRARQDYTFDSDFDFLIITTQELSINQKLKYKAKIRRILAKYKIPADILIQSDSEIKIKKSITGHIVKQALDEGVRI